MALDLQCWICGSELDEPGGLFFGTPDDNNRCHKMHFCHDCSSVLSTEITRVSKAVRKDIIRFRESEAYNEVEALRVAREKGLKL